MILNIIIQIVLVASAIYVNTISMKYYGSLKVKVIVYVLILCHTLYMTCCFIKKYPFVYSIYTLIAGIFLLVPILMNTAVVKPTDEMVLEYFMNSEYANEKVIQIQHTMETDYRYLVITESDRNLNIHIYDNDQLIKNYTYDDHRYN